MTSKYFLFAFFNLLFLTITTLAIAQEKPLRIGAKLGVPNIITANAEYVTPLLNNRVALALDYMSLSKTIDDTNINYDNFEIGTNIYLNNKGTGLYAGISYFSFNGEGTFVDVEFQPDVFQDGKGTIDFNTLNVKVGAKLGGTFYSRIEVGYGFGDIPEFILVKSNSNDETTFEEIPQIPGISSSGLLVFNLGFGFSFL